MCRLYIVERTGRLIEQILQRAKAQAAGKRHDIGDEMLCERMLVFKRKRSKNPREIRAVFNTLHGVVSL
jgi:hypothetical protein